MAGRDPNQENVYSLLSRRNITKMNYYSLLNQLCIMKSRQVRLSLFWLFLVEYGGSWLLTDYAVLLLAAAFGEDF
uniref:Uncharacterized protein n=1 Tax=Strigamia maritima TaxID=126957 RepID=T1JMV8_STRMM